MLPDASLAAGRAAVGGTDGADHDDRGTALGAELVLVGVSKVTLESTSDYVQIW
jgi:hypothetical protein